MLKGNSKCQACLDEDSNLEDGELPGELADDPRQFAGPPQKQRKLAHGKSPKISGRFAIDDGGHQALKPEPYRTDRHLPDRNHQVLKGHEIADGSAFGYPRNYQQDHPKPRQVQAHHRRSLDYSTPQHAPHKQPHHQHHHQLQSQQHQHSKHSGGKHTAAASAGKSSTFEANKAALKARLQSLQSPEATTPDVGNRGQGASAAAAAVLGKGRHPAIVGGESPAAALRGAGAGVGNYVAAVYKEAIPSVEIKGAPGGAPSPHHIRLSDVQALVMWVLSPAGSLVEAPRWAFVKNKPLVQGVVLVLASGLSSAMMKEKEHLFPFLSSLGRPAVVHTSPQARPAQSTAELLTTKATLRNAKRKRQQVEGDGDAGGAASTSGSKDSCKAGAAKTAAAAANQSNETKEHSSGDGGGGDGSKPPPPPPPPPSSSLSSSRLPPGPFPPSHYVASLDELKKHNYPLPSLEDGEEEDGEAMAVAVAEETDAKGAKPRTVSGPRLVCPPGFVATRPSGDPTASERMIALDCEMCITQAGFELTRITLVAGTGWEAGTAAGAAAAAVATAAAAARSSATDGAQKGVDLRKENGHDKDDDIDDGQGEGTTRAGDGGGGVAAAVVASDGKMGFPFGAVLMDELVVPERPILDYNTRYSGITAKMLEGCTNRLEDVRERFLSLVPSESLLVGHALENDLLALRTCHGRVLDTAVLYPHPKGPPYKSALKVLARRFLRRVIQDGSHDSAEDARAALDLVMLKIKHGPSYGAGSSGPHASAPKLADVLSAHCGTRSCLVDRHDVLSRFVNGTTAAVPVASDDDAVDMAGRQAASRTYGFVWTQLTEVSVFLFRRARHKARREEREAEVEMEVEGEGVANGEGRSKGEAGGRRGKTAAEAKAVAVTAAEAEAVKTGGDAVPAAAVAKQGPHSTPPPIAGKTHDGAHINKTASRSTPQADYSDAVLDESLASYDYRLRRLWEALPPRYMLVVTTGAGDTAEYDKLYEQKCKRCSRESGLPSWTLKEEEALVELGAREMQALCFAAVKGDDGGIAGAPAARGNCIAGGGVSGVSGGGGGERRG